MEKPSSIHSNQIKKIVENIEKAEANKWVERQTGDLNKKKYNKSLGIELKKIKGMGSCGPKNAKQTLNIQEIHFLEIAPQRENHVSSNIILGKDEPSLKKIERKNSGKERKDIEEFDELKTMGHALKVHGKIHLEEIDQILVKCNFNTSDPRIEEFAMKRSRNKGTDNALRSKKAFEKFSKRKVEFESKATNTSPDKEVFENKSKTFSYRKRLTIDELTRELSKKYERRALKLQDEGLRLMNLFRELIDNINESKNYFSNFSYLPIRGNEVERDCNSGRQQGFSLGDVAGRIPLEQNQAGRLFLSDWILYICESKKKNSVFEKHEMKSKSERNIDYGDFSLSEKENASRSVKIEEKAVRRSIDDTDNLQEISKALKKEKYDFNNEHKNEFAGKTIWESVTDIRSSDQTQLPRPKLFPESEIAGDLMLRSSIWNSGSNHDWKSEMNGTKIFNICPSTKLSFEEETLQTLNEQFTKTKFFAKKSTRSCRELSANDEGLSKTQKAFRTCRTGTEEFVLSDPSRPCSDIFQPNSSSAFLTSALCMKQNYFGLESEKLEDQEITAPESLPNRILECKRGPKERKKVWDFDTIDFGGPKTDAATKSGLHLNQLHSNWDTAGNQCLDVERDSGQNVGEALLTSELSGESDNFERSHCESTESTGDGVIVFRNL